MLHHRSSSAPLLPQRPRDYSKTIPFVPREVFRLVLRLEAQKALDVNVPALEQRFHVPPGYADDDSLNARGEVKHLKNSVPGPGTYEVPEKWPVRDVTATPTSGFISKTKRAAFVATRRVASASPSSPSRFSRIDKHADSSSADKILRHHTASPTLASPNRSSKSPRSYLRTRSASRRRGIQLQNQLPELQEEQPQKSVDVCAGTFSKLGRESEVDKIIVPAVGTYDINRLWDSSTSRTSLGAPSPALFGASREKRVMTWRPALTPASYTVSTSWDSSRHYSKQKHKVVRSAARRRLQSAKLLARTASSPTIGKPTAETPMRRSASASLNFVPDESTEDDDDPFSWLRQRPNGEQRVNFLAARHGLVHHIKTPVRRAVEVRQSAVNHPHDETVRDNKLEDGEAFATDEPLYTANCKDRRIKVSCRMPGGMLISVNVYSTEKLGRFKEAILIRQKRFQNVNQFDLYHTAGRKLTSLKDTLVACGIRDRSLLQIVPAVTVEVSSKGQTSSKQTTDK